MAAASSLKNRIEQRLREVQKESALVREDIRALRAALEKREELERLPRLKSSKYDLLRVPPPARSDPVREKSAPPKIASPAVSEPRSGSARKTELETAPSLAPGPAVKPRPVQRDERFASLFSSSGFLGSAAAPSVDERVQRNKAIFVLIFFLVALFIVINLLSY